MTTASLHGVAQVGTTTLSVGIAPLSLSCVGSMALADQGMEAIADLTAPDGLNDWDEQTLPVSLSAWLLDWRPFPHLLAHLHDVTSVCIDPLHPPPIAAV